MAELKFPVRIAPDVLSLLLWWIAVKNVIFFFTKVAFFALLAIWATFLVLISSDDWLGS